MASTTTETPQTQLTLAGKVIASKSIPSSTCKAPLPTPVTVTGANRGIGLGVAESCLVNGASHVYSIDISTPDENSDYTALSSRFPGKLHAITANVTQEETIIAAIDSIIAEAGALHGMVVNAGRTHHKAALEFTKEDLDNLWSVNLYGAFFTARAAAKAFIKQGVKGSIVFTASMASYRPNKKKKG
ncbi:uncharacterized protein DSM5745_04749 [Aspergillus mulundensis]|uniref:NAD(P)-binding protein n=1 Tax=Aspergillus mulundensis TaxID=1810919 RepID=A0A3D8S4H5_9EURO|nr:hypothetical protein DSM5745_04749 [Aspergillus mulundensis]RDW81192.1 hypothetical protein DSM5745_04749 [Aspergillus mulundensis]